MRRMREWLPFQTLKTSSIAARSRRAREPAPVRNAAPAATRGSRSRRTAGSRRARRNRARRCRSRTPLPRRRGGAMSATHAFSTPSVSPSRARRRERPRSTTPSDDRPGERRVDRRVPEVANRRNHRAAAEPIRQRAADDRRGHLDDVQRRPQQRDPERRDAELGEAQQDERVARVAEGEQEDDRHRGVERGGSQSLSDVRASEVRRPRAEVRPGRPRHSIGDGDRRRRVSGTRSRISTMTMIPGTIVQAKSERYSLRD